RRAYYSKRSSSFSFFYKSGLSFLLHQPQVIQLQHHHPSRKHLPVERPKKRVILLAFQALGGILQTTSRLVCVLPCGSGISTRGTYTSLLEDFVHAGSNSFSRCTPCCRGGSSEVILCCGAASLSQHCVDYGLVELFYALSSFMSAGRCPDCRDIHHTCVPAAVDQQVDRPDRTHGKYRH